MERHQVGAIPSHPLERPVFQGSRKTGGDDRRAVIEGRREYLDRHASQPDLCANRHQSARVATKPLAFTHDEPAFLGAQPT